MMSRRLVCVLTVGLMLALAGSASAAPVPGKVLIEYWFGGGVDNNLDNLKANANFPDNPADGEMIDAFERDRPELDYYAGRLRAWLIPPETGEYTFWTASDDDSEVWLSTDDNPANAVLICSVEGWTGWRNYTEAVGAPGANRQSAPIALEAGKRYYIEGLYTDGTGGGHMSVGWAGPGIGDTPTPIGSAYVEAETSEIIFIAKNPNPASGTVNVTSPLFQWTAGRESMTDDIYFGTDPNLGPDSFRGTQASAMQLYFHADPAGLTPGATYYWRVDTTDTSGVVHTGQVWTFTVMPLTAHTPNPVDGALWVPTALQASWGPAQNAVSYTVYGAPIEAAVAAGMEEAKLGVTDQTGFDATGILDPGTTYYWRVDVIDMDGVVHPGEVWTFSTYDPNGGAVAEYWDNMGFQGEAKVTKLVQEVNFDWGGGATPGTNSPDADIPVDKFSCRWTAELNVPVTGTYRLFEASDDGARMFLNGVKVAEGWWDRGTTEDASDPVDLVAGERYQLVMEMYENGGGATAFLRWQGPGIPKGIIPAGALMPPQGAFSLTPANGAINVTEAPVLSWKVGPKAVVQTVYLSTDQAKVAASDPNVVAGIMGGSETSLTPAAPFDRGTTVFWKVDVVTTDGVTVPGIVSSFRIADKNTDNWVAGIGASEPNYVATFVQNGSYEIGTYSGDMSYEFIVRSNPDETSVSLCLIGQIGYGGKGALKFEQYKNTTTYGATKFGVKDYDYGVPNAPGEFTHLVFVANLAADTTDLYVNGELKGSIPKAILLSGLVGIGRAIRANGSFVDDFDGTIFGVAIYGRALPADEIAKHADIYFNPIEITDPDLLIYYDFETGSGSTVIDQSGHGNHGALMGSPVWTTGVFGGCLSLDIATLDYVQTKAPLGIVSNTVTVTGWAMHDQTPAGWSGILTHRGTNPGSFGLQHNGSEGPNGPELRYMWAGDVYWNFATGLVVPNGEWYFAALAISPTQAKFYLNGVDQTATNVAEHVPTNFDSLIRVGRDHNDGRIMTALIDEVRFYNRTLTDADIQRFLLADVTGPGDVVQGIPNDGDWPAAELPALMIDDDVNTKFLHFKGETEPSGIQVTPAIGATIVTALTFTTANDAPERDPVKFELSGSNDLAGPWTPIASGDIADFAQADAWPRFTMNATAISFDNTVAYAHYKIVFPALRNAAGANSMQIAEVELLGSLP